MPPCCLPACLFAVQSACLPACLSIYLSVCLSVCLTLALSIRLSVRATPTNQVRFFCLSVCLPVCLPACLPVCLSVCLSVSPLPCLSVCWIGCRFVQSCATREVCKKVTGMSEGMRLRTEDGEYEDKPLSVGNHPCGNEELCLRLITPGNYANCDHNVGRDALTREPIALSLPLPLSLSGSCCLLPFQCVRLSAAFLSVG
jgi:hypothetical protein